MITNLRYALRQLGRTPGFTATAIATLALCLGANLTIFAVVDAIPEVTSALHAAPAEPRSTLVLVKREGRWHREDTLV